jgi:hypothetical protein
MSPVTVSQTNRNITVVDPSSSNLSISSGGVISSPHGTYTHSQVSASSTWVITHNLGCKPAVTIVDSGGNVQIGEVLYNSDNQVTVTFAASFSGFAYLN